MRELFSELYESEITVFQEKIPDLPVHKHLLSFLEAPYTSH